MVENHRNFASHLSPTRTFTTPSSLLCCIRKIFFSTWLHFFLVLLLLNHYHNGRTYAQNEKKNKTVTKTQNEYQYTTTKKWTAFTDQRGYSAPPLKSCVFT